jgi:hypothetical protein
LTGREADLLYGVFAEFAESSRMENLSDEQTVVFHQLAELLADEEVA